MSELHLFLEGTLVGNVVLSPAPFLVDETRKTR
jgi:hypothetical protein